MFVEKGVGLGVGFELGRDPKVDDGRRRHGLLRVCLDIVMMGATLLMWVQLVSLGWSIEGKCSSVVQCKRRESRDGVTRGFVYSGEAVEHELGWAGTASRIRLGQQQSEWSLDLVVAPWCG